MTHLVVLQAVQQDIDVEPRYVVAGVHVRVDLVQLGQQEGQQGALRALGGDEAAAVLAPHGRLVGPLHVLLKPCHSGVLLGLVR